MKFAKEHVFGIVLGVVLAEVYRGKRAAK